MNAKPYRVHVFAKNIRSVLPGIPVRHSLRIAERFPFEQASTQVILRIAGSYVRHNFTDYESYFHGEHHTSLLKDSARKAVQPEITRILMEWQFQNERAN